MLTKKHYLLMFIILVIAFISTFSFFYRNSNGNITTSENAQAYQKNLTYQGSQEYLQSSENKEKTAEEKAKEEKEKTNISLEEDVTDFAEEHYSDIILPTTKIDINIVDNEENILSVAQIDPISLLNLTKEDLQERFLGYEIVEFSSDKVFLRKTMDQSETEKEYRLGTKDDKVCIVVYDINTRKKEYIPLDLSVRDISAHLYNQLLTEQIELTKEQKDILRKSPYYVEEILQTIEE